MRMSFLCEQCSDYIFIDDYIACDCGKKWCSTRCAKIDGYIDRKKTHSCNFCRNDDDDTLFNLRYFLMDLFNEFENEK